MHYVKLLVERVLYIYIYIIIVASQSFTQLCDQLTSIEHFLSLASTSFERLSLYIYTHTHNTNIYKYMYI